MVKKTVKTTAKKAAKAETKAQSKANSVFVGKDIEGALLCHNGIVYTAEEAANAYAGITCAKRITSQIVKYTNSEKPQYFFALQQNHNVESEIAVYLPRESEDVEVDYLAGASISGTPVITPFLVAKEGDKNEVNYVVDFDGLDAEEYPEAYDALYEDLCNVLCANFVEDDNEIYDEEESNHIQNCLKALYKAVNYYKAANRTAELEDIAFRMPTLNAVGEIDSDDVGMDDDSEIERAKRELNAFATKNGLEIGEIPISEQLLAKAEATARPMLEKLDSYKSKEDVENINYGNVIKEAVEVVNRWRGRGKPAASAFTDLNS